MSRTRLSACLIALAALSVSASGIAFAEERIVNDSRIAEVAHALFTYLEGSLGALIMAISGIVCILAAVMGQYRVSLGLLVVAIGAFTLRSFTSTFFNDTSIRSLERESSSSSPSPLDSILPGGNLTAVLQGDTLIVRTTQLMPIIAWEGGKVRSVSEANSSFTIILDHPADSHGRKWASGYAHVGRPFVKAGQTINKGDVIGSFLALDPQDSYSSYFKFAVFQNGKQIHVSSKIPNLRIASDGTVADAAGVLDQKVVGVSSTPKSSGNNVPPAEKPSSDWVAF